MGNKIAKCFNSTLLKLGKLNPDRKVDWKSHIESLVHEYNCTKHDSTGFSAYYLMFGHKVCIVVDLTLERESAEAHTTPGAVFTKILILRIMLILRIFLRIVIFLRKILRIRIFLFTKILILRIILILIIFLRMDFLLRSFLRIRIWYSQNSYS